MKSRSQKTRREQKLVMKPQKVLISLYFVHLTGNFLKDVVSNVYELFITDRVRSTREGYVLTRVCPSVCPQGGNPARSRQRGEGVPQPGLDGGGWAGVPWPGPTGGVPWPGPTWGVPKVGSPLEGMGYPQPARSDGGT